MRAETQKILDDLRVMREEADPSLKYKGELFIAEKPKSEWKPNPIRLMSSIRIR